MIVHNRARCKLCKTIIESISRHHFISCKCGAIFLDGGRDYFRRGGDPTHIEDLSEEV